MKQLLPVFIAMSILFGLMSCNQPAAFWGLEPVRTVDPTHGHIIRGSTITLNSDGSQLAIANRGGIDFYSTKTSQYLRSFPDNEAEVLMVSYSPDGTLLASINAKGGVKIIDEKTGVVLHTLVKSNDQVEVYGSSSLIGVQFSANGSRLIAWGEAEDQDYPLRVWDTKTWKMVATFPGQQPGALSPDGKYLAIRNNDLLSVLEIETQETKFNFKGNSRVSYFSFSPDGKYLLAQNWFDDEVTVWYLPTHQKIAKFNRYRGELPLDGYFRFAISGDGARLATIQARQGINIWDCQTLMPLRTIDSDNFIQDVTFNNNGTVLAGFTGEVVYYWKLPR
jgi:WD40 repeat protein